MGTSYPLLHSRNLPLHFDESLRTWAVAENILTPIRAGCLGG